MKYRNILVALCVVIFATSLIAQQTTLKADIPFAFYVGDKAMPAGHYTLININQNASALRQDDTSVVRAFVTFSAERKAAATESTMVFRHIGSLYFLSNIWNGGGHYGRQLPISKVRAEVAEKDLPSTEAIILLARK